MATDIGLVEVTEVTVPEPPPVASIVTVLPVTEVVTFVPPVKVKLPDVVMAVPVPESAAGVIEVTVPVLLVLLLKVVQSAAVNTPVAKPEASPMVIAGVVVPSAIDTKTCVEVTLVTVPSPEPLALNVLQSVLDKYPSVEASL